MRIYVTGWAGLVGSNAIKVAQERYHAEIIAALYGPTPTNYELDPLDIGDHNSIPPLYVDTNPGCHYPLCTTDRPTAPPCAAKMG